jgi:serine/threonine protein kinase
VLTLSDFGISKTLEDTRAMASSFVGTALYMAPERICGEEYSYASDVWSLGVVGWEGAHGAHPFAHLRSYYDLVEELSDASDSPLGVGTHALPAHAADFVSQCVRKGSTTRPTAQQLLQHPLLAQLAPPAAADAPPLDGESDALRLGAIVFEWLASAQLDVEPALPRAGDSPPFVPRRDLSAHMGELERQLADL